MDNLSPACFTPFRSERFDLRKLYYFSRVVELGSISKASEDLRVAQPALSKSIQSLEFDLRTSLFERSRKGVRPTRAGETLYAHCKIVFRQLEMARAEIQGTGNVPHGNVKIGIPYSVNVIIAAPLLRETLMRFPEIDLEILEEHSSGVAAHLMSNRVDMGVIVLEGNVNAAIEVEELVQEDFVLVRGGRDMALVDAPLRLADIAGRPLILAKGQLKTMVEERFARLSVPLGPVREMETFSMIPQCVEAGIGDAILPSGWIGALQPTRTTTTKFREEVMSRRLGICHSAGRPLSHASLCIKQLVRELAADLAATERWRGVRLLAQGQSRQ